MSRFAIRKTRQISAVTLFVTALLIASFIFVERSRSANPSSGTLNPGGPDVTWAGITGISSSPGGEGTCVEGASCDTFSLTLSGAPGEWAGKKAQIRISWPVAENDFDVYIHKGDVNGPIVAQAAAGGAGPEIAELDPSVATVGTGTFAVRVVYWLVVPTDSYNGSASVVGGPSATPPPGGGPTPTPAPPPGTPRFFNYYSPPGVAEDAGEPTVGVNWRSEQSFSNNNIQTGAANPPIPNGGTVNYYGGFLSYMLRVRFNDCSSPAISPFEQKTVTLPALPRAFGDPILFTDHLTGRTFVAQLNGLTPAGSTMEFTDDDGDTFFPSQGAGPSCIDHQTIGGGPFREPLPPGLIYPHAVYYASQCVTNATSQLSVDGGITFPIQGNMFTAADCAGLHGHLKVAPDGTAYVPDKACAPAGVPFVFGGEASVAVSEDNGLTWSVRPVPGATSDAGVDDPSVGVSWCPPEGIPCDKAERSKTIYLGFLYGGDSRPGIAVSHDKGVTWAPPVDLGARFGIKHAAFPAVVSGDPDRAAFAFFGTTDGAANYSEPDFPGVWHLYIATTFDGGATWALQNLTPNDPIQRGGICGSGTCRNLLDFFDATIDKEGRIVIAGEDGCIGSCVNGGPNSFTAKAFISRQAGGKRMFAAFDPVEPSVPGAPLVSGSLSPDGKTVNVEWPVPDHSGAPITGYNVYRAPAAAGPYTLLASVPVNNYTDAAPQADNYYRVTALNAQGESAYCQEFRPAVVEVPDPCTLPGVLAINDLNPDGSDKDAAGNAPPDPRVNVRQLFVAEPFVSEGVENLVFTLQVGPSTAGSAPPSSQWFIIWNRKAPAEDGSDRNFVAMRSDASGAVSFEYGNFGPALDPTNPPPNANTPTRVGDADSGSYNPATGEIKITIAKSKVENIAAGNDLSGLNVRTYFARPDPGQRSQNNASDITDDATYTVRGNAFCGIREFGKLLNISTRSRVQTGDNVAIGGFIVTGSGAKKVILRGIGPSLRSSDAPFQGRLEDPTLELHDSAGTVIASNDNWKDTQADEIIATGIPPSDDKESAIVRTLEPGAYTAVLRGKDGSTGVALVEAYDLEAAAPSQTANLSTRGAIENDDNVLIGGFITGPNTAFSTKVIVRAIGPSMSNQLANTVADPMLTLHDRNGVVIADNDNWRDSQQAEIEASGLAPGNDVESAILRTVTPGNYTAIVRGKDGGTGVGLVEIYRVP